MYEPEPEKLSPGELVLTLRKKYATPGFRTVPEPNNPGGQLVAMDYDTARALWLGALNSTDRPIRPGDLVSKADSPGLDPREVVSVGLDWLTLDILGGETMRLPLDNYRTVVPCEGRAD